MKLRKSTSLIICCLLVVSLFAFFLYKKAGAQSYSYHTSADAIYDDLKSIAASNPSITQIVPLSPKSIQGRTIYALKISKDASSNKNKTRILVEGGHHAREWIAPEVSLLLAKYLVQNYNANATIKSYIDNQEIWIVPLVNPDGYQYTKGGSSQRFWRKNRRDNGGSCSFSSTGWGVDNNRNWGPHWGGGGQTSANCEDEVYRGRAAYSEPENQAVRNLLQQYSFSTVLSYHSFSQLVLYPFGYTLSPAPDKTLLQTMAKKMASLIKGVHGVSYTPEAASELYIASGDASDYAYDTFKIPAFTVELRPTGNSVTGFALPSSQIGPTWEENRPAALYLIDLLNFNVQSPTQAAPLASKAGNTVKLTVYGLWRGKTAANFSVKIGGVNAPVTKATRLSEINSGVVRNAYTLDVTAPALPAGKHNVEVSVGDAVDTEMQAITYAEGIVTPTPIAQPTSQPTAVPTAQPTVPTQPTIQSTQQPTAVPTMQPTLQPTSALVPSSTCLGNCPTLPPQTSTIAKFIVEVSLHGIGNSGDNTNPTLSTYSNKSPKHTGLNATLYLINSQKQVVANASDNVVYDSLTGSFKGTITFVGIQNGIYSVKIKTPYHLPKTIYTIQSVVTGNMYVFPPVHLTAGNLDDDQKLDVLDYNRFVQCFGASTSVCSDADKLAADINDDGVVNSIDYNLFIREFSVQSGD